ncbi:MAG: hypothetical protein GX259_02220 [Bacteroidales bacterium]|jgi:hypothetical protein|nr:hypothetical protein [Bacteroidales bacterium]
MEQQVNTSELKKTKKPLLITILFSLTSIITLLEVFLIFDKLILAEEVKQIFYMLPKSFSIGKYYFIVGVLVLLILIKCAGSLLMFIKKAWGYILYVIPNVLFATLLILMVVYNFRTVNIYVLLAVTIIFLALYTFALFVLRKRKKQNLL